MSPNFQTSAVPLPSRKRHMHPAGATQHPNVPVSFVVPQAPRCGSYLHSYDFSPQPRIPTTYDPQPRPTSPLGLTSALTQPTSELSHRNCPSHSTHPSMKTSPPLQPALATPLAEPSGAHTVHQPGT